MTLVKYTNKKTGMVSVYESTSHYDPVTKQSRPIRKYLGRLDPATGEIIPSSRTRKTEQDSVEKVAAPKGEDRKKKDLEQLCQQLRQQLIEKETEIKQLKAENQRFRITVERIQNILGALSD